VQDDDGAWSATVTQALVVNSAPGSTFIIDNGDPGTSYSGTWGVSGATNPYGSDSLWSRDGTVYAWTFTPAVSGNYELSMWWTVYSSRSTSVPVDIEDAGGTRRVYINQQLNGGRWNVLGTFTFAEGMSYKVTITSQPGPSSTCADAVKFVYAPDANNPPTAVIDSISPNPALPGQPVTFEGHGTDTDGTITGYSWRSSLDGLLSAGATFITSMLSVGNHTIFFKVQDDDGAWSSETSRTVTIQGQASDEEHIYVCLLQDWETTAESKLISTLQSMGARKEGNLWKYVNSVQGKTYIVHTVKDMQGMVQALYTENAHVIIKGHSNYGLGGVFQEASWPRIYDIYYVDDDKILNYSSPWIGVSVYGMIEDQAYPNWWPIFKDGTSGIMPYVFGDPRGDPPYNYYITYRVPGDLTFYKVETVRNSAIERFSSSRKTAWYAPDGSLPDPSNPDHLQYYITNSDNSFEPVGKWMESSSVTGYYDDDYCYTPAGSGTKQVTWNFTIPAAGYYNIFAWWPSSSANASNAPYVVTHANGTTIVRVDQRVNGGIWNKLGEFYFGPQEYSVSLTDDVASGDVIADAIRVTHRDDPGLFDYTKDNGHCPKGNMGSNVIIARHPDCIRFPNCSSGLDVDKARMKYTRMLFDTCSVGIYFIGTFQRGLMFYSLDSSNGEGTYLYLKAYLEGKSNGEIWQILNYNTSTIYDYYDFNKLPAQQ
jgi:hypothetical protein